METTTRAAGTVTILEISGEIDLFGSNELKKIFAGFMERGRHDVLVNFARASYIDSSGIGVLIANLTRLKKEGGACKLCNVQGSVRMVFELTRLHNLFEIFDSEAEALASFQN